MTNMRCFLALALFTGLCLALVMGADHTRAGAPLASGQDEALSSRFPLRYSYWYFDGEDQGDEMGYAVSTAGDVNGDLWDDVIVGAPRATDGVSREGVAYIFYGSPVGLGDTPDWKVGGGESGGEFGAAVAAAGDVNGDGWDDVIVGAPGYGKYPQPQRGRVTVFFGSDAGPSVTPDWTFEIGQADARLGVSVAAAGNVNGDAYDDLIVGAQGYEGGQSNEGAAFVFYGSASGPITTTYWMTESNQASALFGMSVSSAGDVNDDGYDDVIVGAAQFDDAETNEGAAFVYYGSGAGLSVVPAWSAVGGQAEAEFGASVSAAGDVNGDGFADVVVGAPEYDAAQDDAGAAYVFYGSDQGLSPAADWWVAGPQAVSRFGRAVAAAGDVNADGFDDVIVGAPFYKHDEPAEGGAFVYLGSATGLGGTPGWVVEGNKAEAYFGSAVATAGYVNRDDYDDYADIVVGAPNFRKDKDIHGRAFAYHGASDLGARFSIFLPCVLKDLPGGSR